MCSSDLYGSAALWNETAYVGTTSGTFYAQDLSSFGTTVDGVALPRTGEGDEPAESALPARAVIGLAGVVSLEFEARS